MKSNLLITTVLLLLCQSTQAAADEELARRAGARALAMAERTRFEEGKELLLAHLKRLATDDGLRAERAILLFHLGFLMTRQADAEPANADRHLGEARRAYLRVLRLYPDHEKTTVNLSLVMRRLGKPAEALELLQQFQANNDASVDLLLALGDSLARTGDTEASTSAYWRAEKQSFDDPRVVERVLGSYRRTAPSNDSRYQAMFDYCDRLAAAGSRNYAARGFADLAAKHAENGELADRALLRFVEERSSLGTISNNAFATFGDPSRWQGAALPQLTGALEGRPGELDWWRANDRRRHAAASAIVDRAETLSLEEDQISRAVGLFRQALEIAPTAAAYAELSDLARSGVPVLRATTGLAQLYSVNRNLDPEGERTRALLEQQPERGLPTDDPAILDSVQKYHASFGFILKDRQDDPALQRKATQQFEFSLRAEQKRAEKLSTSPRPMPELHRELQDGYLEVGRIGDAVIESIEASKAYLDLREVAAADRAAAVGQLTIQAYRGENSEALRDDLQELQQFCERVQRYQSASQDERVRGIDEIEQEIVSRPRRHESRLDSRFWSRQYLQMNAELEIDAHSSGNTERARHLSRKAATFAERLELSYEKLDPRLTRKLERLRDQEKRNRITAGPRRDG